LAGFATVIAADRGMLDLSIPEQLASRLDALGPDIIVNPAAYTAVDRAEDEQDIAYRVNATSPGVIAQWAAARRVPLIQLSTDYVFDGSGEQAWREDDVVGPLNVYGASKLAGEQAVQSAGGSHLIVRTSWVYAAEGTNFLRTMIRLMREREELSVVANQYGAPTSAAFIADVLTDIVRNNLGNLPAAFVSATNKLHLTAAGTTSWHGFAEEILRGLERRRAKTVTRLIRPIPSAEFKTKATRPLNSRLDLSRLANIFQIQPKPWSDLLDAELDRVVKE
jgi:dTDP-4-dehydrorhamnose reductase